MANATRRRLVVLELALDDDWSDDIDDQELADQVSAAVEDRCEAVAAIRSVDVQVLPSSQVEELALELAP